MEFLEKARTMEFLEKAPYTMTAILTSPTAVL